MTQEKQGTSLTAADIKRIREAAEGVRYGSVTLVFQDGVLIQIDRSEKFRIQKH